MNYFILKNYYFNLFTVIIILTYLQSLALFVKQTQIAKIRGKRILLNLEWPRMFVPNKLKFKSCNELVEHEYLLHKYEIQKNKVEF